MPTREAFLATLLEFPLIQGLQTCARRLQMRFAVRGGVVRNYLFGLTAQNRAGDFYEFVDPFSDIDLVVDSAAEWPPLAHAISESIPFAGFHRWEALPTAAMHQTSKRFALIPADRLVVWFDGRQGDRARVFLEGLDVNVEETVQRPALPAELTWTEPSTPSAAFTQTLDVLRLARYTFAFPHIPAGFEPAGLLHRAGIRKGFGFFPPLPERQMSLELRRLELAILDLVFTAADLRPVFAFLDECRAELPPALLEHSRLLSGIFYQSSLNAGTGIGVVLYKPGPRSALRTRVFNDTRSVPPALGNTKSLIPWLKLSSSGHSPNDCCHYRDFENGVATVAWRLKGHENAFLGIPESGFATVAVVRQSAQEYARASGRDSFALSLPGFVRKGRSLVLRVDHGYVRAYFNRNASFYLGLIPTSPG